MTENEAMKNLETLERFYRIAKSGSALHEVLINFVTLEDLVVAIQALEEIQQYRAIGTVEQLEWCKDASHWKELFKEKLEKYEAIGTIEEFKALKEKNVAKKPIRKPNADMTHEEVSCPSCGRYVSDYTNEVYCNCGQKLDWE